MNLNGKRVTVMGLGLHGGALGTVQWLVAQGALVTVTDMKTEADLQETIAQLRRLGLSEKIQLVLGEHRDSDFVDVAMVIRNPAVPRTSRYLRLARDNGVPIEMDSSLFFRSSLSSHLIGITGSKGKTTTARALAAVLTAHNPHTVLVGVEGTSPLGVLSTVEQDSFVVFELSSWRLEALDEHAMSPCVAVVTSLYRDHLNTYTSFDEYVRAKKTIIRYQKKSDIAVLNYDDELVRSWGDDVIGTCYWYSLETLPDGLRGIFVRDDTVMLRTDEKEVALFPRSVFTVTAPHTQRNLLPAALLGFLYGGSPGQIQEVLHGFHALPHRLEPVATINQVAYINDSAATMPDATIAALRSLSDVPLVLILGGNDKELLFDDLAAQVARARVRGLVFLPGTVTTHLKELIFQTLPDTTPSYDARSMTDAVQAARDFAQPGDTVLLSPGATSFGSFRHEFDRGNQFIEAVRSL